jgi:hypothetical protein
MSDLSIDEKHIMALGPAGRAELSRRLTAIALAEERADGSTRTDRTWRKWFIATTVGACLALIPWIVLLALKLPPHIAGHWHTAWVGFDIGLLASLAATAWAAWRHRYVVILFALIAATLLVCDAWFDVMTARAGRQLWFSLASAAFGELPLAVFLLIVVHRLLSLTVRRLRLALGLTGPVPPLHRVRLLPVEPPLSPTPEDATLGG